MSTFRIAQLSALEILDSRGNPTLRVRLELEIATATDLPYGL